MSVLKERLWESKDPFLSWLRDEKGLSKTTLYHYHSYYRNIILLDQINQKTLQRFIQNKKNNDVVRATIRCFLDWLKTRGHLIEFEMPPKQSGRKKKRIINTYSDDQMDAVRDACYKRKYGYGVLFDLLYYGALRRAEIQTINYNSFNWDYYLNNTDKHCECKIDGKGKKQRIVLIPPVVMQKILDHLLKLKIISHYMTKEDMINILSNNKKQLFNNLYEWKVWDIINSTSKKIMTNPMRPHEIRHHRATELQNKGVNIRDIQHYLGHSNPQITEIYLHTTEKRSLTNIRGVIDNG